MQKILLTYIHLASLLLSEKLVKYPPFLSTLLIFVEILRHENTEFLQKYTHYRKSKRNYRFIEINYKY